MSCYKSGPDARLCLPCSRLGRWGKYPCVRACVPLAKVIEKPGQSKPRLRNCLANPTEKTMLDFFSPKLEAASSVFWNSHIWELLSCKKTRERRTLAQFAGLELTDFKSKMVFSPLLSSVVLLLVVKPFYALFSLT